MAAKRLNCVCIDSSKHSEEAFDWYAKNHHRSGDVIGLLHVHQMPQLPSMGLMAGSIPVTDDYHKSINSSIEESRKLLQKFEEKCKALSAEYKVLSCESHHSPGQVICEEAKKNNADVIVLGQRGLSAFSRALLGSTSDYVLHHSSVPVVVVPPSEWRITTCHVFFIPQRRFVIFIS